MRIYFIYYVNVTVVGWLICHGVYSGEPTVRAEEAVEAGVGSRTRTTDGVE